MNELDQILAYCKDAYINRPCCQDSNSCKNSQKCASRSCCNCEECVKDIHHFRNSALDYNCIHQTYFYVMKFFYRYASEIAIPLIKYSRNLDNLDKIKVVSIGCGPSSELYGIKAFLCAKRSNAEIEYYGFDRNEIWSDVQNQNQRIFSNDSVQYSTGDAFGFIKQGERTNLLVLNYVLSDLARHNDSDDITDFINQLQIIISQKLVDYILFNDIYLTYETRTAYSLIIRLIKELKSTTITSADAYHFKMPNSFQPKFGNLIDNSQVIFNQNIDLSEINPRTDLNSIGLLLEL